MHKEVKILKSQIYNNKITLLFTLHKLQVLCSVKRNVVTRLFFYPVVVKWLMNIKWLIKREKLLFHTAQVLLDVFGKWFWLEKREINWLMWYKVEWSFKLFVREKWIMLFGNTLKGSWFLTKKWKIICQTMP